MIRHNPAPNHETPTPDRAQVARPPRHISEERRSGQQSYGFKPSEITRSSISYTQLHCSIESGATCLSSPCYAPAPPRAGRTARRFGAPLTLCARQQTESVQRNAPRLTGGTPATRPRMTAVCRPAEVPPLRATHRIPLIARRPLFRGRLAGPKHALLRQVAPDSTRMAI